VLDSSFGTAGRRVLAGDHLAALAVRPDGSLVGLHPPATFGNSPRLRFYAANGATLGGDVLLDSSFGPGSLDIGTDGSVVLGGFMTPGFTSIAVAKVTPGGALDTTFDADGYALIVPGGFPGNVHVLALPDGGIAVTALRTAAVTFARSIVLGRVGADGAAD